MSSSSDKLKFYTQSCIAGLNTYISLCILIKVMEVKCTAPISYIGTLVQDITKFDFPVSRISLLLLRA